MRDMSVGKGIATGVAVILAVPGVVFLILTGTVLLVLLSPTIAIALALDDGDR
jgi:hypothetical protein